MTASYKIYNQNCFEWLSQAKKNSFTSIVTDPPYGVKEYESDQIQKQREGKGGIWRIPQSFDGNKRAPVPRFSVINDDPRARQKVYDFFLEFGTLALNCLVPGGHIFIASTPLLSDVVSTALRQAGFERRGEVVRTVLTLRGGDRPKGAEEEFSEMSVIPRGAWEPWGLYRKPISEKTIAQNIRRWGAGALRRPNADSPFFDLIQSEKTSRKEREIANHPSIKPQKFLRQLVRASVPTNEGLVLDPFAGSGSTIAAATFLNLNSVGVEQDKTYYEMALKAIPLLAELKTENNWEQPSLFSHEL